MADPLSIASGIVGLITAAGKLASIIGDFVQNTKDAPSLATGIMTELIALKTIFHAVQKMMLDDDTGALDETRLSMISVNDLRLALMGCICVMDSLEREICGLNVNHVNGRMQKATSQTGPSRQTVAIKLKWGLKTSTLKNILNDLQRHKLTLNLMLTTINWSVPDTTFQNCTRLTDMGR